MAQNPQPSVDPAEADFRAWALVYDSLKFNSSTLQAQLASFDAKATGLIAAGGVVIGLAASVAIQHPLTSLGSVLLVATVAVLLVAEAFGLAVVLTGFVQVPYITLDQIAQKPGPRDDLARNLTRTFSAAIANSRPSHDAKRRRFAGQVVAFIVGTVALGLLLTLLVTAPTLVETSTTSARVHNSEHAPYPGH